MLVYLWLQFVSKDQYTSKEVSSCVKYRPFTYYYADVNSFERHMKSFEREKVRTKSSPFRLET